MKTLLEAVNDVLLGVGERPTTNLLTPVGRKAVLSIQFALSDINAAGNWVFKRLETPITQWSQEFGTIPGLERIDRIHTRDTNGRENPLTPMPVEELRAMFPTRPGVPRAFAVSDSETVIVLPFPVETQDVIVYGSKSIVLPKEKAELIDLPERFYNLLMARALYHMLILHLSDQQAAATMDRQFLSLVSRMVQQETPASRRDRNMFRRRTPTHRRISSW